MPLLRNKWALKLGASNPKGFLAMFDDGWPENKMQYILLGEFTTWVSDLEMVAAVRAHNRPGYPACKLANDFFQRWCFQLLKSMKESILIHSHLVVIYIYK